MVKKTDTLAKKLLQSVYTTETLKSISDELETLAQDHKFLKHAEAIVTDNTLTKNQKQTQLGYVLRQIESPLLYDFFSDQVKLGQFWLFRSDAQAYFDAFVQAFQLATEDIEILFLSTAIDLKPKDIQDMAQSLGKILGYHVIINHQVNPALIGGVQARLGNTVMDLSLRTKFRHFQKQWLSTLDKTSQKLGRHVME